MSNPKRHHYLPQFYLRFFARNKLLWIYDRELNEFRKQPPINTTVKKHYYAIEQEDGEKNLELEKHLADIEGKAKGIISKLVAKEYITDEEKITFSVFLAYMNFRVPDFEKSVNKFQESILRRANALMFSDEKHAQATLDQYKKDTGDDIEISATELVEFQKNGNYEIQTHRNESLRIMVEITAEMAKYFSLMDWGIHHAPKGTAFITTDNPFLLTPPPNYEPNIVTTQVASRTGFFGGRKTFFNLDRKQGIAYG
ncbi:MAG: DUF4238 domain-containing protein [Verrucomicrobia bacterium]|nr:DUF4238 domain-containing protein [Verrucomicrobiota bacterium]